MKVQFPVLKSSENHKENDDDIGQVKFPVNHKVIVQSLFRETTRNGKHTIRLVRLGLSSDYLLTSTSHSLGGAASQSPQNCKNILEIQSMYALDALKLSIFKKSKRRTLKVCIQNKSCRYFELEQSYGPNDLWATWCKMVFRLQETAIRTASLNMSTSYDFSATVKQWDTRKLIWNDKDLYLGSMREDEDKSRPKPTPGLGPSEEIKLLCLKSKYFGSWDQTAHWVQCESNKLL